MMDRRVRLRPKPGGENYVYGDLGVTSLGGNSTAGLLSILRETNGMVWNFTPTINEQHSIVYDSDTPVHNNASYNSYRSSPNAIFSIVGAFHSSTPAEAYYTLACLHFLRSVSKMDSGRIAASITNPYIAVAGAPPPILLFSGYGDFMYSDIPVIVKNFSFSLPEDVDYVRVPISSSASSFPVKIGYLKNSRVAGIDRDDETWVPTKLTLTVQLEQQPTPDWMSKKFNLNDFKRGALIKKRGFV